MCNLYAQNMPRQQLTQFFGIGDNHACAFEPQNAIFPGDNAIVIKRTQDGRRVCVRMSWGFVLNLQNCAPKRVTNFRDDKIGSSFWSASLRERRCLVPATSFAEPKGKRPATWHWFALGVRREPFAFAGIWRSYKGPIKTGGETVEIDVYSIMTTVPNSLVATVHPSRMPVMLTSPEEQEQWLNQTPEDALKNVRSYPSEHMAIVQSGPERWDTGTPI